MQYRLLDLLAETAAFRVYYLLIPKLFLLD